MNRWLAFCKRTVVIIDVFWNIAWSALTFQILPASDRGKTSRSAIRFEHIINGVCFVLSPLIIAAAMIYSLIAVAAIGVAAMVGYVVHITAGCTPGGKLSESVQETEDDSPLLLGSHVKMVQAWQGDVAQVASPVARAAQPVIANQSVSSSSSSSSSEEEEEPSPPELSAESPDEQPSYCQWSMM